MPNKFTSGQGIFGSIKTKALSLSGVALTATFTILNQIGAAFGSVNFDRGMKIARVALANVDTGGGVFSWANPEASAIVISRVVIDVTTKATGACTVDIGTTSSSATTSSNNLLTGLDVGTAAGTFDNVEDKGASGKARQRLAAGKWVTASKASGASAGLVGFAYIHYTVV